MKTKRICKSTVSLILALIMLVSMCTVAFVNVSAAETDTAETGATTYYFGFTSWSAFKRVWMANSSGGAEYTSLVNCNTTVSHDIGNSVGNQTYNVYSLTVDTSYTTAYVTITNNNQSYETAAITLDSSKITLISEYGGVAKFGQTAYGDGGSSGGDTTTDFPYEYSSSDVTGVYFVNTGNWSTVNCHSWSSTTDATTWPGTAMTKQPTQYNGYDVYYIQIPSTHTSVIFNNGSGTQTGDLTFQKYSYYVYNDGWYEATVSDTTDPTEEETTPSGDPTTLTTIYFMDNSSDGYMTNDDADIYAKFDSDDEEYQMIQRVDTISGKTLWSTDVPANTTSVTFYRRSKLGTNWGSTWTVSLSGVTSGYYKASNSGSGSWESDESTFSPSSDDDITNFWYGVWVDSMGNGNGYDAVRWWNDGSAYHIFLPSNTPDTFNLYTSFDEFEISSLGVSATKGNYAEVSNVTYDTKYSATYLVGATTTGCSVYFHKSANVSTLFFTTDDQLWTDKITNSEILSDVSGYKDGIETKGSIYLYDENGELVNDGKTDLKKIKGRGNSSFEASMKLYGKYAYNFNLDKKVSLIDGAQKTKKWCLLVNNVDHAMLRNTFAYSLAADIGLAYSPKTRHVDVYDNGEYLGACTIIEKVEYGSDTLMNDLISLDDEHEGWYDAYNEANGITDYDDYDKEAIKGVSSASYTASSGGSYTYKYWTSDITGFTYEHADDVDLATSDFNFLLEHELSERYYNEASWFKAPSGQYVVVKYPEFATQKEMQWAMDMYDKMHQAAYSTKTLDALEAAIDVESFAKVYLIQELGLNLDSCATSYYIHNDTTTNKLVAGPVWDYDWSFGSYHKAKAMNNGSTKTSSSLDNPKQMFVRYKDITNNTNGSGTGTYNLQAQLTQTEGFWTTCQDLWTNKVEPAIKNYIDEDTTDTDDTGIMLSEWLPALNASVEMNNIRWNNTYATDESEDWGTKLTADYDKGTYDFNVDGTGNSANSSGSSVYSYANTVYYLNDWIKTRMVYMSGDGGLYDKSLLKTYEFTDIDFDYTVSEDNVLTVTPKGTVTLNGIALDASQLEWQLVVNYTNDGTYNAFSESQSIQLDQAENIVSIEVRVIDDPNVFDYSGDKTITCSGIVTYAVSSVVSNAVQSDDKATVTVTPSATVTKNEVESVELSECSYEVIVNNVSLGTLMFSDDPSYTFNLEEGSNSVQVIVYAPNGVTYGESDIDSFVYSTQEEGIPVTFTVRFKSSTSYRYLPQLSVNGETAVAMTATDESLGYNIYGTQEYKWFEYSVTATTGTSVSLNFSNQYNTTGATCDLEYFAEGETYFFGVDNLNNGTEVVDLTQYNTEDLGAQAILNFKKSAAHMVYNDSSDGELATTSLNGAVLLMGDTDEDDNLSVLDATNLQLALAKKTELTETGEALADYNLDEETSIMDVTEIQTYLVQ